MRVVSFIGASLRVAIALAQVAIVVPMLYWYFGVARPGLLQAYLSDVVSFWLQLVGR